MPQISLIAENVARPVVGEDLYRLALAVADAAERAQRLDWVRERKVTAGYVDIQEAALSGDAFMVKARADIMTLDADSPKAGAWLDKFRRVLEDDGLLPVLVLSGGDGRRHLFVLITDEERRQSYESRANGVPDVEVRTGNWIRPPGAPHPNADSLTPGLLWPHSAALALARLDPHGRSDPGRGESSEAKYWRLVRRGDTVGAYSGDESALTQAILCLAIGLGFDLYTVQAHLADVNHKGGEGYRRRAGERGDAGGWAWLRWSWRNAEKYLEGNPPFSGREEAVAEAERIAALYHPVMFTGRTGSTDWDVMSAHLAAAVEYGGPVYYRSQRDLKVAARRSLPTVRAANARLEERGFLRKAGRHQGTGTTEWRIMKPDHLLIPTAHTPPTGGMGKSTGSSSSSSREEPSLRAVANLLLDHDAWESGALGSTAKKIWIALDAETPKTARTLGEEAGCKPDTVRDNMKRLVSAGFADLVTMGRPARWVQLPLHAEALDAVAQQRGTAGRGQARADQVAAEREAYEVAMANRPRRARRGGPLAADAAPETFTVVPGQVRLEGSGALSAGDGALAEAAFAHI